MPTDKNIETAISIIGENQDNDYILAPASHAEWLQEKAPDLAALLTGSEALTAVKEYKRWNKMAIDSQAAFKKWTRYANFCIFLTACFAACLTAAGAWSRIPALAELNHKWFIGALSLGSLIAGVVASVCISRIQGSNYLNKWMQNRAKAESYRLRYFEVICAPEKEKGTTDIHLSLLKLEYFRRFQLDVQLTYYEVRGRQHGHASEQDTGLMTWAMGAAALISGVAGYFGQTEPAWAGLAALGLIATAFAAKVANSESMNQDKRNSERYERTRESLAKLFEKIDAVRRAVGAGDERLFQDFVRAVHDQLSLEHRQWLDLFDERQLAFAQFEQQLKKHQTLSK